MFDRQEKPTRTSRVLVSATLLSSLSLGGWLPGCTSSQRNTANSSIRNPILDGRVPQEAFLLAEGPGKIGFTAPSKGLAYLYNEGSDRILFSFLVSPNDKVSLAFDTATTQPHTADIQILVNDKPVFARSIPTYEGLNTANRFYFVKG